MRYAIGDVHGCYYTLKVLIKTINPKAGDKIIFLGDYVDRGPYVKKVLDFVLDETVPYEKVLLRGNHEEMFLEWCRTGQSMEKWWRKNGGGETIKALEGNEEYYRAKIEQMPYYYEEPDYYCVHATFDYRNPLTDVETMVWERYSPPDMGKPIVAGHTVFDFPTVVEHCKCARWIRIDNGCVFNYTRSYGRLFAFCLDDRSYKFQNNIEGSK